MAAFQIPRTPHTTNKTIRFPDDVIADVEAAIAGNASGQTADQNKCQTAFAF